VTTLVAKEFAGYRVESLIGRGGMGVVYRALDLALERPVALKVLSPELTEDADFRRRFALESKLAASLDHPNVIPIHAAGEHDGVLFIAMRYVPGDDLRGILRAEGRLAPERAVRLLAQVAAALDAAHAAGLVHRDVKPANVLVAADDHAYLTDFGLSKRVATESQITRTGNVMGTLDYIAPEQIRGEPIGSFTDVYALGCMAVHLLTGAVPFTVGTEEAKLWAQLSEPAPRPGDRVPALGARFDAAVTRAMSKRAEDRHPSAGALGKALLAAAAPGVDPEPQTEPEPEPPVVGPAEPDTLDELLAPSRPPARPPPARAGTGRADLLRTAATEPFGLVVLTALLVAGAVLGALPLMVPLALLVYAASVARSFRDPDTAERARRKAAGRG
jgi:serine/threonine protein kinase